MSDTRDHASVGRYCWVVPATGDVDRVQATLMRWAEECTAAIASGFDSCKGLLEKRRQRDPHHAHILRVLQDSCHGASESVLILLGNRKVWHADCLARSVAEGTVRFAYLCVGSTQEIDSKLEEYDGHLPEIAMLKRHKRVRTFLEVADDGSSAWAPLRELALTPEESERLGCRYPKRERRQIEDRWSFGKLLESLATSGIPGFEHFRHLFYNFGMSSHVLHQDSDGIQMIWERNQREPMRRDAAQLAHGARMVSDVLTMNSIRLGAALHLAGKRIGEANELQTDHSELVKELHRCQSDWNALEYSAQEDGRQDEQGLK